VHSGDFVGDVRVEPRYSRWRAGPTTFGPAGKIAATLAVILMGPWTGASFLTILYVPAWIMLSTMILKQVWARVRIDPDAPPTRMEKFREHHPALGMSVDPQALLVLMGLLLVVVAALTLHGAGLLLLAVPAMLVCVGALLAWLAGT
jgi:hypothetical protein